MARVKKERKPAGVKIAYRAFGKLKKNLEEATLKVGQDWPEMLTGKQRAVVTLILEKQEGSTSFSDIALQLGGHSVFKGALTTAQVSHFGRSALLSLQNEAWIERKRFELDQYDEELAQQEEWKRDPRKKQLERYAAWEDFPRLGWDLQKYFRTIGDIADAPRERIEALFTYKKILLLQSQLEKLGLSLSWQPKDPKEQRREFLGSGKQELRRVLPLLRDYRSLLKDLSAYDRENQEKKQKIVRVSAVMKAVEKLLDEGK